MNAHAHPKAFLDPIKEAQAVAALKDGLRLLGEEGDDQLLADSIEGETSLFEVVDAVIGRIREASIMVEGLEVVIAGLQERKRRHEEAQKRDRALIEQSMSIAGLDKIVRPTATLSLSQRAPSLAVTEESEIPARYWRAGAPTLDKKGLTEALRARHAALASLPEGAAEREAVLAEHPEIPGATLTNGAPSLTIRIK